MSDNEFYESNQGIDRLQYFLAKVVMIAAVVFVVTVFGPDGPVMKITSLILMFTGVYLDVQRLRNIGVSQWFSFIRFLPFGNTFLDIGLTSAQTRWAETRRLDRAGRSILFVELLLLGLMMFLILKPRMSIPFYI